MKKYYRKYTKYYKKNIILYYSLKIVIDDSSNS